MPELTSPPSLLRRIQNRIEALARIPNQIQALRDLLLADQTLHLQRSHPNPLNRCGKKCFSQSDEDGITLEILRRLNLLSRGAYAEFGVGTGIENNSLILAALGWKGFWVGGEMLAPNIGQEAAGNFSYIRKWITLDNIIDLTRAGMGDINASSLDFISLDLDGNDIYFVEKLLSTNIRPALFIVEYNAKFPPPVEFKIAYNAAHTWQGDDHFGASLYSFNKLFRSHGYRLVCCNSHSGANAFFVDSKYGQHFSDVSEDLADLYVQPRFHFYGKHGHSPSLKTVEEILNRP